MQRVAARNRYSALPDFIPFPPVLVLPFLPPSFPTLALSRSFSPASSGLISPPSLTLFLSLPRSASIGVEKSFRADA